MNTPENWPMYIDADGQYGSAWETVEFEHGQLTEEQWETLAELDGYDRLLYVQAVLDNDTREIARILSEDLPDS